MKFFRRFGFLLILLALWMGTTVAFWHQDYATQRQEHEEMCEKLYETVFSLGEDAAACTSFVYTGTTFWSGVWENMQSEFAQLFVQGLLLIAFAEYVAYKAEEKQDRVLAELSEIRRSLG